MKHTLLTLLMGSSLLLVTSCRSSSGVCLCHYPGVTRDTLYKVGNKLSLSDVQAKCLAIQHTNPDYDSCMAQVLKD